MSLKAIPMPAVKTMIERNPYDSNKIHFEMVINYGEKYFSAASYDENSIKAIHGCLIGIIDMLNKYLKKEDDEASKKNSNL